MNYWVVAYFLKSLHLNKCITKEVTKTIHFILRPSIHLFMKSNHSIARRLGKERIILFIKIYSCNIKFENNRQFCIMINHSYINNYYVKYFF